MCSYRYARQFPTIFSDICEGISIETTKLLVVFPCFPPCLKGFRLYLRAGSDSCSQSAGNYTIQYSLW